MSVFPGSKPGPGTYLAQGAAANAILVYVLMLGALLYQPQPTTVVFILVLLPFNLLFVGICGAIVGFSLWLAGVLRKQRLGLLTRAVVGIVLPILITLMIGLGFRHELERVHLVTSFVTFLTLILPAALLSGSKLNPLRSVILGLEPAPPLRDFGRAFSFVPGALLRFGSALGMLEAMIYLANLPSWALSDWRRGGEGFLETMVAIWYFGVTAVVSYGLPRKPYVVVAALLSNVPVVMWAVNPHLSFASEFLAGVIWVFAGLWVLFVIGRLLAAETARSRAVRILPVTMFEIRIRHALNHW